MKRKSTYQKLKERVRQLEHEMYVLIREPESLECANIKACKNLKYDMIDAVFSGCLDKAEERHTMQGIYPMIYETRGMWKDKDGNITYKELD